MMRAWLDRRASRRLLLFATSFALARSDPALDARLKNLEEELRCLVCQNQTLADSNAPLAEDLRREVRELAWRARATRRSRTISSRATATSCCTTLRSRRRRGSCGSGRSRCWPAARVVWLVVLRRRRGDVAGDDDDSPTADISPGDGVARARAMLGDEQQEK